MLASHGRFNIRRESFDNIVEHLRSRQFRIKLDPGVSEIIRENHRSGARRDLRLVADYGIGLSHFEFYQELVTENRHGGRYDFSKFARMPKRIQWFFRVEKAHLTKLLTAMGFLDNTKPGIEECGARNWLYREILESGHYHAPANPWSDVWVSNQPYNCKDRDGKAIKPGEVKYFYHYTGTLKRGVVVKNLNNMWWVITGSHSVNNVSANELFDWRGEPSRNPKRGTDRRKQLMEEAAKAHDYDRAKIFRDLLGIQPQPQQLAA